MGKPTIADVAQLAGVSTATVSRALTGNPNVRDHVRQQVRLAAESLGYKGNAIARALRQERSGTVGMIVPDISNPFFTLLVDGVEQRLRQLGMSLVLCTSRGDATTEAGRLAVLQQSQVDAVLISPTHEFASAAALRDAAKSTPVVQIDQFADSVETDWVGLDDAAAMRLIVEHVADQGARTAAYVGGDTTDSSARTRLEAVRSECDRRGIVLSGIELGPVSVEGGEQAARRLSQAPALSDVIICGADIVAYGVLQHLDAIHLDVPFDVMVTGFDDISLSSLSRLSLTTIRQPIGKMAEAAVEMVRVATGPTTVAARRTTFQPELMVRASTSRGSHPRAATAPPGPTTTSHR